ncbi:MAG: type 1 glutamine amidotransferase [Gammaproteobacteria bacterium]|nr:type 1 glutamine amidotransferase [Gammaproteobacteria bacterium]
MKRAVIIAGNGVEDSEFIYPYYRLQEENIQVDIAIAGDQAIKGKYGMPFSPTIKCSELQADDFELAILPGGHEGPDRVRQVPEVLSFIKAMNDKNKLIASICHGSWTMISAGIMKGRKATCYKGMKDDLINSGCEYLEEDVVVDNNIVSSPHFRNNHQWLKAIINSYNQK